MFLVLSDSARVHTHRSTCLSDVLTLMHMLIFVVFIILFITERYCRDDGSDLRQARVTLEIEPVHAKNAVTMPARSRMSCAAAAAAVPLVANMSSTLITCEKSESESDDDDDDLPDDGEGGTRDKGTDVSSLVWFVMVT